MADLSLRVGSTWLNSIARVGDIEYTTTYGAGGGGLLTASWSMALPRGYTHPALRQGVTVDLVVGTHVIGSGIMADPDRDEWRFVIDGLKRVAERMVAVDGSGNPSTDLSVVIPAAVSRTPGLPWRYVLADLPVGPVSSDSEDVANLNYLQQVIDKYCEIHGKRWLIDRFGVFRLVDDPTAPTLALTPGVPSMATAADDYVMRVYARRVSAVSGTPAEPSAWAVNMSEDVAAGSRWGVSESIEDITNLGYLSSGDGQDIADAILDAGRARPAFTQAVAPHPFQITTIGGTTAPHWLINEGAMVRHQGWLDSDGALAFGRTVDWVIGSKTYREGGAGGAASLTIGPVGLAARTSAQNAAKVARELQASFK